MPYPYDQVFAADPATPENVASNGVVTIFAPGDPDRTPLTITTLDGLPLPNPMQVNDAGFGPAFMHATHDQVAWAGGGFTGLFVSYKGMKDEAVAARVAAEGAQFAVDDVIQRADAGEFVGRPGPEGKPGPPGVNAVPASEAVAEYANTPGNPLNKQLKSAFGTHSFMLTPDRFASIDNTGGRDTSAPLQAALDSLPYGATAILFGTYRIKAITIDPAKFLTVDATAANLVMTDGPASAISCVGSFEDQIAVSSITTEPVRVENGSTELTRLTVASPTSWRRGDIIKVIADDVIPGAHRTSDTAYPRVGEYMTVYSVSGTSVYLQGVLNEPFATNIRAARLVPGSVTIIRPSCNITDERLADKVRGNMFRFESLIDPKVIGGRLQRLAGAGLLFKSCYGYSVENLVTLTGIDNTDIGVLSYSVQDSGSVDGRVTGGTFRGGRHGFTDGSADTAAGSPTTADYGASMNFLIDGVTVRDMTAACLDTHHNGTGGRFVNCTTYPQPGQPNYLIRGRNHRVINPTCWGGESVIRLVTQISGSWSTGETWGIEMVNPRSFGTQRVVTTTLRTSPAHPEAGKRSTERSLTITGGYHEGLKRVALLLNSDVRWKGSVEIVMGASAEGALWETQNAALHIDDAFVDATRVANIAQFGTQRVLYGNDPAGASPGSDIHIGRMRLATSAIYRAAAALPFEVLAGAQKVNIEDLVFDTGFAAANPVSVSASVPRQAVRWRVSSVGDASAPTLTSSAAVPYVDAALTGSLLRLLRSPDPALVLLAGILDGTPRTLAPVPNGKYAGQTLRIILTNASAPLTLANGVASNMGLKGSTNKVLSAVGDQVVLWWSGSIWRQENSVV